jgi:hypothetical protein
MLPILFPLQSLFGNGLFLAYTLTESAIRTVSEFGAAVRDSLRGFELLLSGLKHNLG